MKAWQLVLWILTAGTTIVFYLDNAMPSASTFLCLVLLALILAPIAFLLTIAIPFPAMRGHRLTLGAWLIGTVVLLHAGYDLGQQSARERFYALQPVLESQIQKDKGPYFFYQGEVRPNQRCYYVWCGAKMPPRFRVVIPRAPGWYEVRE
ncbi:MAG: hypothetical protein QM758_09340 [Armatimonas sp.]